MLTATAYDTHVEQLFDRVRELHGLMTRAGIPYRLVGGMAVFLHVSERDPIRGRLTADVDAAIEREHLPAVIEAAKELGWVHRHVAGVDMLVEAKQQRVRSAVHLFFADYASCSPAQDIASGYPVASVVDLVRMKLASFRLKDRVHVQDMDGVGLIDAEVENQLSEFLRARLAEVRASE